MSSDPDWLDPDELGDAALMARLAEGDRGALAVLVRRHQQKTLALAYRFLGGWDAAEDVAQDAFVRVFEAAPRYRPSAEFTTWLYRIVANLCWDRRRKSARAPLRLSEVDPAALAAGSHHPAKGGGPPDSPDAILAQAERTARIRAAVGGLPDRQRLVLVLHRYEGLSHRQISEITGWSAGAVESCLVRAYQRLRRDLADLADE